MGDVEGVDCGGGVVGVGFVDADGVGEGEGGEVAEVRDDEGGDLGEEHGVAVEGLSGGRIR